MGRLTDHTDDPTGRDDPDDLTPVERAQRRGRRRAIDVVTGGDPDPDVETDGGLSPATIRWMQASPGATDEAALAYDRSVRQDRRLRRADRLDPRGDPGAETNRLRAVEINAARRALREYNDLERRTK